MSSSTSTACQSEAPGERARRRVVLPGPHEADQIHLVGSSRVTSRQRRASRRSQDRRWRPTSAPSMRDGPSAGEGGDREGHRHPVIAVGVGLPGAGGRSIPRRSRDETVRTLVGVDAERAEPGDERGDAVAFLDAQFGRAAHAHLAAVAASAAIAGSSSMSPGTSSGAISTRPDAIAFDDDRAARLAARRSTSDGTRTRAPKRREDADAEPSASGSGRRPRFRRATRAAPPPRPARTRPTRSRRGRRSVRPASALPAGDRHGVSPSTIDAAAKRHQRPLGVVARRAPARRRWSCPSACRPARSTALFT